MAYGKRNWRKGVRIMIRLENLEVSINKSEIIKGVSFHVNKGDFVGLIGPNGSGKSTILKTIYKLIDKKCGAIYINGKEIANLINIILALRLKILFLWEEIHIKGLFN